MPKIITTFSRRRCGIILRIRAFSRPASRDETDSPARMCLWTTDTVETSLPSESGYKSAPLPGSVTDESTVFLLFTLRGRSSPEPPSTHPEDFLFALLRGGNLAQMWLQTEEKLQGLKVGSGPSFEWPQDLRLPGICLFFSSLWWALQVPVSWVLLLLLLNSCF